MILTGALTTAKIPLRERINWTPQPRQAAFLKACGVLDWYQADGKLKSPAAPFIGYGGAAGGGKSDAFLALAVIICYAYPGAKVTYFRRTYPELEGPDGAIQRSQALFNTLGSYNDQKHRWNFDNGSSLYFRHCHNEKDVHVYQSQQFNVLLIDEGTHFTWPIIDYLVTRNRSPSVQGLKAFTAIASNPGSVGHGWYSSLFDIHDHSGGDEGEHEQLKHRLTPNGKYEDAYFIPARLEDNQILMQNDPDYERKLSDREGDLAEALRWGNWQTFQGQAFKDWSRSRNVIDPFAIPASWPKWRAVDWGKAAPFCCLWLTRNPDSERVYVYRELYANQLTDRQQARTIAASTAEPILFTYADPSMWESKSFEGQEFTTADEYSKEGVILMPANNDRLGGKRKIDRLLQDLPDGKPGLQVFSTCPNLIRTLPLLVYDPVRVEDIDTEGEDHAYDALRYGLTNTNQKARDEKKERPRNPLERYSRRF